MAWGENKENESVDLSDRLRGSGAKSRGAQKPPEVLYPDTPKIVQWVIKYSGGYVTDKKQANYVLLGFVAMAIIIAVVLIFGAVRSPSPPPPDEIINVAGPQGER